jgi:copper chaperone CopZ
MRITAVMTLLFLAASAFAADTTSQIKVSGMTCSACAAGLGKTLERQKGVKNVQISFIKRQATVVYDDKQTNEQQIRDAINKSGFKAEPPATEKH